MEENSHIGSLNRWWCIGEVRRFTRGMNSGVGGGSATTSATGFGFGSEKKEGRGGVKLFWSFDALREGGVVDGLV